MVNEIREDDEISLTDIIVSLWRGRGIIILFTAMAATISIVYVVASAVQVNRPASYYIELRGVDNGRYPNGTAFSPQNLLAPEVLSRLRQQFQIPSSVVLRDHIVVSYASPSTAGINEEYDRRLSANNLSIAEIEAINTDYRRELADAMSSAIRIDVNFTPMGVDGTVGIAIARAIPEIWAQVYSTQFRIFDDQRLANASVARTVESLEETGGILVANQRLRAIERGLSVMEGDNRLSLLQTDGGVSVTDLAEELKRFRTLYFNALMTGGIVDDDGIGAVYLEDIRLQMQDLRRRIATYDRSLEELRELQKAGRPAGIPDQPGAGERDSVQLGESGLGAIVDLAERASQTTFVQEILRQRQQLAFEVSALQRELESVGVDFELPRSASFKSAAEDELKQLSQNYLELLNRARQRIQTQLGELYVPVASPEITGSLVSPRSVLIVGVGTIVGFLLSVVVVLIWSAIAASRSDERVA